MDFTAKPTILVVDDTPDNLSLMSGLLKDTYRVKLAINGEKALQLAQADSKPDLILLDIMMPGMSGYEVCEILKADPGTRDIPIIFLTAMTATQKMRKRGWRWALRTSSPSPSTRPSCWRGWPHSSKLKAAADFLKDQNSYLETEVQRRGRELAAIQDVTILAMASLAETRDNDTGNHIRRTQHYLKLLAEHLKDASHAFAFPE
jgi:putative two-component system response regulator